MKHFIKHFLYGIYGEVIKEKCEYSPRGLKHFFIWDLWRSHKGKIFSRWLKYIFFMTISRGPNKIFIETFYKTFFYMEFMEKSYRKNILPKDWNIFSLWQFVEIRIRFLLKHFMKHFNMGFFGEVIKEKMWIFSRGLKYIFFMTFYGEVIKKKCEYSHRCLKHFMKHF